MFLYGKKTQKNYQNREVQTKTAQLLVCIVVVADELDATP